MEAEKHSGPGISSFVISLASGILLFLLFAVAGIMETSTPGGINENSPAALIIGLCVIGLIGLAIIALGLGIAGLLQSNRKKLFAVLGTVFSGLQVLGTITLIAIGLAAD